MPFKSDRAATRTVVVGLLMALGCSAGDDRSTAGAVGTTTGSGAGAAATASGSTGSGHGGGVSSAGGGPGGTGGSSGGGAGGIGGNGMIGGSGGGGAPSITDASGDANDASLARDGADGSRGDAGFDASGGDSGAPYNPCPPKGTPCVIMPVGDSITQGAPNPPAGGYRVPLFHLAHMNQQTIVFVGSGVDGPATVDGVAFPRAHEGHSGFNIDATQGRQGVSPFFPAAITTYKPNIVLLMIGTNDVDTGESDIPMRLGALMDSMLNADPKLLVVVAQIVPQQTAIPDALNVKVEAFNAAIPSLVKSRADAGKHVTMVDMYRAFTANPDFSGALLADRLHPTPAGFNVMADTWYAAIRALLR